MIHAPLAAAFILCFHCSLSSSGAMWPGIKTETGLPEAPSGGQPGFLSFSTAYTSTQPGHLHYSYPSQGKLQPHSDSHDTAVTLCKHRTHSVFPLLVFVPLILRRDTFIFLWRCFSRALFVSRLKLHNIQCVLQHPFSYGRHHNLHHSSPPGQWTNCVFIVRHSHVDQGSTREEKTFSLGLLNILW